MKYLLGLICICVSLVTAHAQALYQMPEGQQSRVSSFENPNGIRGNGGKTNKGAKGNASETLQAGETKTLLKTNGPGSIQRMWITVNDRSFRMLRSLRLRMYWDDETKPAVDVPFGDFFCAPLGRPVAFQSALFANPESRSFNCYIPMPFKTGAKITLTNENTTGLEQVFYDIDFVTLKKADPTVLYFHACWNREIRSALEKDFVLLPTVYGKGRFLGVNVGVNIDSSYGNTWWGEGEVKMYMDGDKQLPTIVGTGAEDYVGTGWGEGVFMHQYQGCLVADRPKRQYSFYRFHIPDQVFFYTDFKATIQKIGGGSETEVKNLQQRGALLKPISIAGKTTFTRLFETPLDLQAADFPKGWVNFYRVDDYSATAYFYLDKPYGNLHALAPVGERIK